MLYVSCDLSSIQLLCGYCYYYMKLSKCHIVSLYTYVSARNMLNDWNILMINKLMWKNNKTAVVLLVLDSEHLLSSSII